MMTRGQTVHGLHLDCVRDQGRTDIGYERQAINCRRRARPTDETTTGFVREVTPTQAVKIISAQLYGVGATRAP